MPWQLSYAAMADADNAELQTDVMRFMAILAFCLVAIFAIVQSLPATPAAPARDELPAHPAAAVTPAFVDTDDATPEPIATAAVKAAVAAPVAADRAAATSLVRPVAAATPRAPEPEPVLRRAAPTPAPARETLPVLQRARAASPAAPQRPAKAAVASPAPPDQPRAAPATTAGKPEPGLSLRFASDAVLRGLVHRGVVSLYAIEAGVFHAMTLDGEQVRFVAGAAPSQYHEMIAATVPTEVVRSFGRQHRGSGATLWGVTLPPSTSQQLMRFVRTRYSGELVITADAGLALAGG